MARMKFVSAVLIGLLLSFTTSSVIAGPLGEFEKAATEEKAHGKSSDGKQSSDRDDSDDNLSGALLSLAITGFFAAVTEATEFTTARISPPVDGPYKDIEARPSGAPDLVFFRTDINYQHVSSDISGLDGRVEVGYGPYGLQVRQTHYKENETGDKLDITNIYALLRMSGSSAFEIDVGLGGCMLKGEESNSGSSLAYLINIYPYKHIGLRIAPTWNFINGHTVGDHEASIGYVNDYYSIRAGYRRMNVAGEVLDGPYLGLSFHY